MSQVSRLENVEALASRGRAAAWGELSAWIASTWSGAEREAWHRIGVHWPADDDMRARVLARLGLSEAEHRAILEATPAPTDADGELVAAAFARCPADLAAYLLPGT